MDFSDTPNEAKFRKDARAWLADNATLRDGTEKVQDAFMANTPEEVTAAQAWQKRKADGGWAGITWPKEHGGRGGDEMQQIIWNQEEGRYKVPPNIFVVSSGLVAPTLIAHGTEQQKTEILPTLLSGEGVWCQLFSEPAAGSDLAGIRTRARRDGDDWVITGQKIWTSGAHYSGYGILLARSNVDVAKHKGLTMFVVKMDAPGIEARRIKQISGHSSFNEVFFDEVRIPDSDRLGPVDGGWRVAMTTLTNERYTLAIGRSVGGMRAEELIALAAGVTLNGRPAIENDQVRAKIAEFASRQRGMEFTSYRIMTALSRGKEPMVEGSIGKLLLGKLRQEMASFALELSGSAAGIGETPKDEAGLWRVDYLTAPGNRISGGSDEIQRNIIAERLLGMPPEIRADKDTPFSQLK